MPLPQPSALLFDWDNTLVDSWQSIHQALEETFQTMGLTPWTFDETRARVRASARDSFPVLFGERAEEATRIFYAAYERERLTTLHIRPGARELLRELGTHSGLVLGVISNKRGDLLRWEARHLGWASVFHSLVGANDAARDKPAPEAVRLALEGSDIEPGAAVWLVGDTDIDMQCAANVGLSAVLVREDPPQPGEFEGMEPDAHFPDLEALHHELARIA